MKKYLAMGNVLVFAAMLYVNYLGGSGQINDLATGEVSDMFPTLFTPAPFTFAIWGVIYLLGALFIFYQLFKAFRLPENFDRTLNRGFFFVCVANAMWMVAWSRLAIGYSMFLMVVLFVFLLGMFWKAKTPKYTMEYVSEFLFLSMYLGWISVATIANAATWLTHLGVEPYGQTAGIMTVLLLVVVVCLSIYFIFWYRNIWFPLVIVWALYGIFMARTADTSPGAEMVQMAAFVGLLAVFCSLVYFRIRQRKASPQ